ncbi:MAG: type II secretion system F family protein [Planctomycetales bacterium]|nr:type II secretion system F family protein [Planctomycetales bacterium]
MPFNEPQYETPTEPASWADDPLGRMSVWQEAGAPLPQMLRALAEEYGGRAAPGLEEMARRVEARDDLSQAFQAARPQLPGRLRAQLQTAAASGELRTALPALASQRAETQSLTREATAILCYPLLVVFAAFCLTLFLSVFVVPQFASVFSDFGLDLPFATIAFLKLADGIPLVLAGLLVVAAVVAVSMLLAPTRRWFHWFATSLPLFGRLWTCHSHYCLANLLSAYTASGMNGPAALRTSADGLVDQHLAAVARRAATRCDQGQSMAQSLAHTKHIERSLTALVRWGEAVGDLPAALAEAARNYRILTRQRVSLVRRVMPPVLLILVVLFVGFMCLALFLPLVSLVSNLSG